LYAAHKSQACLNAPESASSNENGVEAEAPLESPEEPNHAQIATHNNMQRNPPMAGNYMTPQQQQAMAYQNYMAQQQGISDRPFPMQAGQHPPQA
jgi:pheromone receptor transcription factor